MSKICRRSVSSNVVSQKGGRMLLAQCVSMCTELTERMNSCNDTKCLCWVGFRMRLLIVGVLIDRGAKAATCSRMLLYSGISYQHTPWTNKKAQLTQGLRATAVRVYRHLGFLKFQSCTISSAVPENPTLEPNSTSIGKPVAKLWPFLYIQDGRQPPSWILSNRK